MNSILRSIVAFADMRNAMGDDDRPMRLTVKDHWGGWVMLRLDDGWCAGLDRNTMKCTIYGRRPIICRDFQTGDCDCTGERLRFLGQRPWPSGDQ